ncbi:molybdopterin oxidoreductase [Cellulomonas cellasea]|nr:molybdopterin oxidoreductase [Cellulomonas cellasea]MDM8086156.1 molybdopterin oxidoreductase [Cellulomonas cellasea]
MGVPRTERAARRRHVEWWVLSAWLSLGLLVLAGLTAAAGVGI